MTSAAMRIRRIAKWSVITLIVLLLVALIAPFLIVRALIEPDADKFGQVQDEAMQAGLTRADLEGADEPYFAEIDKGLLRPPAPGEPYPPEIIEVAEASGLSPEEVRQAAVRGQNMWIIWTGGNDRFWDFAARTAIGSFELLKILSSHPSQGHSRGNRWRYLGLANEPCFIKASESDPNRNGLWLDQRDPACTADPFGGDPDADERYPGVPYGERGQNVPVGSYYGEPSGIVGLRLFSNPDFDAEAEQRWDPERFYTDPSYYNDKNLVRPYRVGMSCAFCHVGPNPINPPKDPENPTWAELSSNPGAQYYWVDRIFFWNTRARDEAGVPAPNEGNFLYQLFHTNPPGSLDTSLVSTDYMNNPRTMNAVYEVPSRLALAARLGHERLAGDEAASKQFHEWGIHFALVRARFGGDR